MAADDRKETEAREARGHGGQEKKPSPAIKAFSFYQPEYNNESRPDSHQTSQDLDQRVGCGCHPQDHAACPFEITEFLRYGEKILAQSSMLSLLANHVVGKDYPAPGESEIIPRDVLFRRIRFMKVWRKVGTQKLLAIIARLSCPERKNVRTRSTSGFPWRGLGSDSASGLAWSSSS